MKRKWIMMAVMAMLFAVQVQAEEPEAAVVEPADTVKAEQPVVADQGMAGGVQVLECAVAAGIEAREPVGAAEAFSKDVNTVYCWTKIGGVDEPVQVVHRWKKGDEVMAEVPLNVGGAPWRIYSSKKIMPEWTGSWSVDVVVDGQVIKSMAFSISE